MTGPSWRQRLKPFELVGLAAVLGVFAGAIALVGSRSLEVALILAGIAFIVALLVLAMLALAASGPAGDDQDVPVLDRQKPPRTKP
jgi:membrane protein implicated in regulation of membrane protease activity